VSKARIAVPFVASSADPAVRDKPQRRKCSAEDQEADLRRNELSRGARRSRRHPEREGIYSSTVHGWRKARDSAVCRVSLRNGATPHRPQSLIEAA
jgi:hypothetical protein